MLIGWEGAGLLVDEREDGGLPFAEPSMESWLKLLRGG